MKTLSVAILSVLYALFALIPAHGSVIGPPQHRLDPNEQAVDHDPPGAPQVSSVQVTRGRANPPGRFVDDAELGTIVLTIVPPTDNRTPANKMGYEIVHGGGQLPGQNLIPPFAVDALRQSDGTYFIPLYWIDGATNSHPPIQFVLGIRAVDLAGNLGPQIRVTISDPPVTAGAASNKSKETGMSVKADVAYNSVSFPGTKVALVIASGFYYGDGTPVLELSGDELLFRIEGSSEGTSGDPHYFCAYCQVDSNRRSIFVRDQADKKTLVQINGIKYGTTNTAGTWVR